MAVLNPLWKTDPVQYLVLRKFPQLAALSSAASRKQSSLTNQQWQNLEKEAEVFREELRSMPAEEMKALLSQARLDETAQYEKYRENEERQRVFNRPEAAADCRHWASASYWTLDEITALSFGKDPRVVTWKVVSAHTNISPFAKAFADRRDIIHRAGVMGQLAQHTQPSMVIAWAQRMRVSMPAELVAEVESLGTQIADWKTLHDQQKELAEQANRKAAVEHSARMAAVREHTEALLEAGDHAKKNADGYKELIDQKDSLIASRDKRIEWCLARICELEAQQVAASQKPLGARERDSLLKMVIGMAMGYYGYDPKAARGLQTKQIADDLERAGIALDVDTVRKYLNEAKELLRGDETDQDR